MERSDKWLWVWWKYDLTKAAFFLHEAGWRLWARVLVIGPIGLLVIWREKENGS